MIEQIKQTIKKNDCDNLDLYTLVEKEYKYVISLKQKYINIETDIKLEEEKYCYIYKNECIIINSEKLQELHLNNSPKYLYYLNESVDSYYTNLGLIRYPTTNDINSMDFKILVKIVFQFIAENNIKKYSEFQELLKKIDINSIKIDILKEFSLHRKLIEILIFIKSDNEISNYLLYFNDDKIRESLLYLYETQKEKEAKKFTIIKKKNEKENMLEFEREKADNSKNKRKGKKKNDIENDVENDKNNTIQNAIDRIIKRDFQIQDEKMLENNEEEVRNDNEEIDYDDDWYDL